MTELADPTKLNLKPIMKFGGFLGFMGGFLFAYQRSSCKLQQIIQFEPLC